MRYIILVTVTVVLLASCGQETLSPRSDSLFDENWLFYPGETDGGERITLDDAGWRKLDLPHDWSIEDLPGNHSPFDSTVVNGVSSGFTRGGVGWYRKHFTVGASEAEKKVFIRFDGVYMDADVWINGHHAGNHFYGYSPFEYEISNWMKFGSDNVIAVRVNNDSVRCRWYSGSGIFRHVRLMVAPPLHIETWGTEVTTVGISEDQANIIVKTSLINQDLQERKGTVYVKALESGGSFAGSSRVDFILHPGETGTVDEQLTILSPHLWSPEDPYLYAAEVSLFVDGKLTDRMVQSFGIRTLQFDAQHGFRLNGKETKLRGGCVHHDNGPLGSAAFDRAEERKVGLLKAAGFNALRMAHNPPSAAILDACDRLGMMVIDEAFDVWRYGHFSGDYSTRFDSLWQEDLGSMILRDRNHPCIIMWSIGNEIRNTDTEEIAGLCGRMADFVSAADPTRPVTAAVNAITPQKDAFFSNLDVCGYNYCRGLYLSDHERLPHRVMFCSESYPSEAYDYWQGVREYPWVIGDFVWTAFDHIGEASIGWRGYPQEPGFFPWNLAWCGDLDICGTPRPQSWHRQTLWKEKPIVRLFVTPPVPSFPLNPEKEYWSVWDWPDALDSWNFKEYENTTMTVSAYTNCDEVELLLNGISLGKKTNTSANKNILQWDVPYRPGELTARGYKDGHPADSALLRTAGAPSAMVLIADRDTLMADGQDLCYVSIELVDRQGTRNPLADNTLKFNVSGAGSLAAVGNANPVSLESFRVNERKAWQGRCLVILRSGKQKGIIRMEARADGLPDAEINIRVE